MTEKRALRLTGVYLASCLRHFAQICPSDKLQIHTNRYRKLLRIVLFKNLLTS
jgi:hypothetical protein